jgi:hypothetical protein
MQHPPDETPSWAIIGRQPIPEGLCWVVYHAQEHRAGSSALSAPLICASEEAWLGAGYYFWVERFCAEWWGLSFKRTGGMGYDLYAAWLLLDEDWVLNTTFSERDYAIWRATIEEAIQYYQPEEEAPVRRLRPVQLKDIMEMVHDLHKAFGFQAIVYDDQVTQSSPIIYKERATGKTKTFHYQKRIQVVVFDLEGILYNFERLECNKDPKTGTQHE